jgi:hypothetical protein
MKRIKKTRIGYFILLVCLAQACAEVIEKPLTNEKLILTAPVDSLVTADSSITFYWEPIQAANKYQFQVVSPKFDSIARFIADTIIRQNSFRISLDSGKYQWRVRALNFSTSTLFSGPRNFTIK